MFALQYQDELWEWPRGQYDGTTEPGDVEAFKRRTRHGQELLGGMHHAVDGLCLSGRDGEAERKLIQQFVWDARRNGVAALRQDMRQAMKAGEKRNSARRMSSEREQQSQIPDIGPRADRPVCPRLAHILQQLSDSDSKLCDKRYPSITASPFQRPSPKQVIVFIAGGVTFEEVRCVHEFNRVHRPRLRVTLGGDRILKPKEFVRVHEQ